MYPRYDQLLQEYPVLQLPLRILCHYVDEVKAPHSLCVSNAYVHTLTGMQMYEALHFLQL